MDEHHSDVIMDVMASEITNLTIVCSTVTFRRRSKKTPKHRVTGLCVGNSQVTGELPAKMASNAENVSIWWRHHEHSVSWGGKHPGVYIWYIGSVKIKGMRYHTSVSATAGKVIVWTVAKLPCKVAVNCYETSTALFMVYTFSVKKRAKTNSSKYTKYRLVFRCWYIPNLIHLCTCAYFCWNHI